MSNGFYDQRGNWIPQASRGQFITPGHLAPGEHTMVMGHCRDDRGRSYLAAELAREARKEKPLTSDELDLLCSYARGPRIWDAAELVPGVYALEDKGLIERVPGSPAHRLTELGRGVVDCDVTDADLAGLGTEAASAGDLEQAGLASAALDGDKYARAECARVILTYRREQT